MYKSRATKKLFDEIIIEQKWTEKNLLFLTYLSAPLIDHVFLFVWLSSVQGTAKTLLL